MWPELSSILPTAIAGAISAALLIALYRRIAAASPACGAVFAAGVVFRCVLGVFLFVTSSWHLPLFSSLQRGYGFWALAIDAEWYFHRAADAARDGLSTIANGEASPMYLRLLTIWMKVAGVSVPSSLLLNVLLFAGACAVLMAGCRRASARHFVALSALSVSPALVIFGTQPLKDSLVVLLLVCAVVGTHRWLAGWIDSDARSAVGGFVLLLVSVFTLAGIRAYLSFYAILAIAIAGASMFLLLREYRWRAAVATVTVVPALWAAFVLGAGGDHRQYQDLLIAAASHPSEPFLALGEARRAFEATRGATSLGHAPTVDTDASAGVIREPLPDEGVESGLQTGLAAVFLPVTLLRSLSVVAFSGGKGLLVVTDADTIVMDVLLIASLFLIFSRPIAARDLPTATFVVVLVVITSLTLAYVVTNFGTLFRLRLMAVVPLWALAAVVRSNESASGS